MSAQMAHRFLARTASDHALQIRLNSIRSVDELLDIAATHGFTFTEAEFNAASYSFSDDLLLSESQIELQNRASDSRPCTCGRSMCHCDRTVA